MRRQVRVIGAAVLAAAAVVWLKAPGARAGPYGGAADAVAGTEAAPDEGPAMPAPTKKKWVDPFDQ